MEELIIHGRKIGKNYKPLVIAEIGINHEGSLEKAVQMVEAAAEAGCECVKIQTHIIEDEMISNNVIPANADESIWNIISRCALTKEEEEKIKILVEKKGMIFLSTPFSRAAADQLESMGVQAYKIGSGECNNYPLIRHIAAFGKPIILSTGMNDISSISPTVEIFREFNTPYVIMHCTSMYPTPYDKVRLGAIEELRHAFPDAVLGLSDHSLGNYTCFAAVALGASVIEKHFTCDKSWPGPDVSISIDTQELKELIEGSNAIYSALAGSKNILPEEQATINFAYACVVTTKPIKEGEMFTKENIWVKRPGTGNILAKDYEKILGKIAKHSINANTQLSWEDFYAEENTIYNRHQS